MKMSIKQEEYVRLAKDLLASLNRDLAEFAKEDTRYEAAYVQAFESKIAEVEGLEAANTVLVRQKQATQALYDAGEVLTKSLKSLKVKLQRAGVPTGLPSEVLKDLRNRNYEGAVHKLGQLVQVVTDNRAVLEANGMKPEVQQELAAAGGSIARLADAQTQLMKQVAETTGANRVLYDALYDYIAAICEDGKVVFEGEQQADEYRISAMLKKVRRTRSGTDAGEEGEAPQP